METNEKLAQLENEIKVLKNEVQAVLLDLRDKYLEAENPFNAAQAPVTKEQIIIDRQPIEPRGAEKGPPVPVPENVAKGSAEAITPPTSEKSGPHSETAHDEHSKMSASDSGARLVAVPPATQGPGRKLNLITVAGLARWAEGSVTKLGQARTETILDISEMMGLLPQDLGRIMAKLVNLKSCPPGDGQIQDYLESLIE